MGGQANITFHNLINGELRDSAEKHRVIDPRTEEELWECPVASSQDLDDAVAAAAKAFPSWSGTPLSKRQEMMAKLAKATEAHSEELISILSKENGKSTLLAGMEFQAALAQCSAASQMGLEDEIQYEDDRLKVVGTHVPVGCTGAIIAWNFPLYLSAVKFTTSVLTGNCVILKPSLYAPYTALKWVELCARDIFPPGVVQTVNGGDDLGSLMTHHAGIQRISFTGSSATGRKVMAACSKTLKRVSLELGGNDAAIVCADVDIEKVADMTSNGSFVNAGQMCIATKRIYCHESIFDTYVKKFVESTQQKHAVQLDAGAPSLMGPLTNKMQYDIVKNIIDDTKKSGGGEIVAGGKVRDGKGYFLEPTVVVRPREDSLLVQGEQFGPIVPILSWSDETELIARVNLNNAGLGASVFTNDTAQAERLAAKIDAGSVWVNMPAMVQPAAANSGMKESGMHGEMGMQGLRSSVNYKSVHISKV